MIPKNTFLLFVPLRGIEFGVAGVISARDLGEDGLLPNKPGGYSPGDITFHKSYRWEGGKKKREFIHSQCRVVDKETICSARSHSA